MDIWLAIFLIALLYGCSVVLEALVFVLIFLPLRALYRRIKRKNPTIKVDVQYRADELRAKSNV